MTKRLLLAELLTAEGIGRVRARQIAERIELIKRKRKPKKPKRINRNRAAVRAARASLAKAVKNVFDKQRPKLAAQISELIRRYTKADGDPVDRILPELDFDGWVTLVIDGEKILVHIVVDGSGAAIAQVGVELTSSIVDQVNEAAAEWAKERSASMVGMKYLADGSLVTNPAAEWAITESTRELLRADVTAAIEEGLSTDDLAARLVESYAFSDDRAEMIARTEIANADIQGSLIGWKESGVVEGKELLLSSEHAEPDECDDAADMGVVDLDDDFGGLGDPPYHPNCECDVSPVLTVEGEEEA
jgi:Phage Mu protein F like protein